MKIVALKKLVEENDIDIIEVNVGEGVKPIVIEKDSPDYREQKEWFVKGMYAIGVDDLHRNVLKVEKLEQDIHIELPKHTIVAEDAPAPEAVEDAMNMTVTALVFHRATLTSAGKEVMRKHVSNFADAVVEKYRKDKGEAKYEDFAVVEIDWNSRTVWIERVLDPEAKE